MSEDKKEEELNSEIIKKIKEQILNQESKGVFNPYSNIEFDTLLDPINE